MTDKQTEADEEIVADDDEQIDVCVGIAQWTMRDGRFILEEDFATGGEVWRVHKYDADPIPSRPHAHCISGGRRFVGCKLHLGTAELYQGSKALGRYLHSKQFNRLIELIRPKFPDIPLPLPTI